MAQKISNHHLHEATEAAISALRSRFSEMARDLVPAINNEEESKKVRLQKSAEFQILSDIVERLDDVPSDLRPAPADLIAVLNGER